MLIGTRGGLFDLESPVAFENREVTAMTARNGSLWALLDGRELVERRSDQWTVVARIDGPGGTCVYATPSDVLVGTLEAHLYRLRGGELERVDGFEAVEGRAGWYTPWGAPADARTISGDAHGGVYVNVHVGGIVRSLDGVRWEPTIDVNADVHQVLVEPDSGSVLAATAYGLGVSVDGGASWTTLTDGLHARYQRAVAVIGDTVLVSSSTGPSGRQSALYRRPLHGDAAFERCRTGLPEWFGNNIDSTCLAGKAAQAAFGTEDGLVFVSDDQGATWRQVAEGLPPVRCLVLD